MRLIDADALKDAIIEEDYECHQFCYPCKTIMKVIDAAPTAQPELITWLLDEVWDEEAWELNYKAFPEILCRKLAKLGYIVVDEEGKYVRIDKPSGGD